MGKQPTKAADNIYCKCRKEAAIYNSRLGSREGASELIGISSSSLADYELNNTIPPVDKVTIMADIYNAPELRNYYCANQCPIGQIDVQELAIKEIDRSTLELMSYLTKVTEIKDSLLSITADGVIDSDEEVELDKILAHLDTISKATEEFKLSIKKSKIK